LVASRRAAAVTYVVTRTATTTVTNVVVVEKPYVHPITYVVIGGALHNKTRRDEPKT
jgi:hypothetical protein